MKQLDPPKPDPNTHASHDPQGHTLLDGAPYKPSTHTNVQDTWRKYGWTPPSESRPQPPSVAIDLSLSDYIDRTQAKIRRR